jgi:hypothetical protein
MALRLAALFVGAVNYLCDASGRVWLKRLNEENARYRRKALPSLARRRFGLIHSSIAKQVELCSPDAVLVDGQN